ncbi:MAG: DUF5312 family protein [Treponema sp.]|jgi:hypothetical protein|nr:DUF5312 family protein [Treponema sp.]
MGLFFSKLWHLFSHQTDSEAIRKRVLKTIVKNINSNRYSKFYKAKLDEAEPALGKFFFDMYKTISPAQVFMQYVIKTPQLKQEVINQYLNKQALAAQERLSGEAIEERARNTPPKELSAQLREEFKRLTGALDGAKAQAADACYSRILAFAQFTAFDFLSALRKFDPAMQEHTFSKAPSFKSIDGSRISEDLKDFLEAAAAVEPGQDWKEVLRVLRICRENADAVAEDQWMKLLANLQDVKDSRILELIVRHSDKNPNWQPEPKIPEKHIVNDWREGKRTEILEIINRITNAKRNAQVRDLAKLVFEDGVKSRIKNYTEQGGDLFVKKGFAGFRYITEMNYLKAFLLDCFKKDIRELCDFLLVRGQWTPAQSSPLSNGFHALMTVSDKVLAFDEALGDTGAHGSRLKVALAKAERDSGQARYVKLILNTVNEEARTMLAESAQALINIGKNLKQAQDDYQKEIHLLIANWKELEANTAVPLGKWIADVYKKIYYFIQILQIFIQSMKEPAEGPEAGAK